MGRLEELLGKIHPVTRKGIVYIVSGILIFSIGFLGGTVSNIKTQLSSGEIYNKILQMQGQSTQQVQGATQEAPPASASQSTEESAAPSGTAATDAASDSSAPTTTAEILDLFTKSANKIKTDATKVTRNYENREYNEELRRLPSLLQPVGSPLISTFLTNDETPIEYATTEEIAAKYPVQGQTYVSQAKESDIASAVCDDDGTYYNITLKFNESVDPAEGEGCASSFNCIKADEVTGAPGVGAILKSFSLKYYDAVITCKIEKATGNMVSANYTLPIILSVTANMLFSDVDAQVGMTFVNDYTIEY